MYQELIFSFHTLKNCLFYLQVVIKYVPYVGDSKRALDEYTSEIMMNGKNTIVCHNTCEDSLLATPIILDLIVLTELCQRISFRVLSSAETSFQPFHSVLSILSYLCKAPLVPRGAPVVNALARQRQCIENLFRGCLGLPPLNHMGIEYKLSDQASWCTERPDKVYSANIEMGNIYSMKGPTKELFLTQRIAKHRLDWIM